MNKYLKLIDLYIEKTNKKQYPFQDRLDFLNKYNYDYLSLSQENTITLFKLFYTCFTKNDMNNINYFIDRIKIYIDKITGEDYLDLNKIYEYFSILVENSSVKNYLIDYDTYENMLKNFKNLKYPKEIELFFINKFSNEENIMDINAYNYFLNYLNTVNKLNIFKEITDILEIQDCHIENMNELDKINSDKVIKDNFPYLLENIKQMNKLKESFIKEQISFKKHKNKELVILNKEKDNIKNKKNVDYIKILHHTEDPLLTLYMIDYNNSLVNQDYIDTLNKIDNLKKEGINNKERILNNYNCNIDYKKILISDNELELKIKYISENFSNLKKYNNIMLILINDISYEELKQITYLLIDKEINENFILNNIILLKERIKEFITNLKILKYYNLSIKNIIKYDCNILFMDSIDLEKILKRYNKYEIVYDNELYNYEFLKQDYSYIIDKFIEIGEYNLIKNNISLANENSDMIIKRCIFNKEINEPILNKDGKLIGNLRKEDVFLLTDNELNDTIIENYQDLIPSHILNKLNNKIFDIPDLKIDALESFKESEIYYNFNGMIVSKNKVLKNYYNLIDIENLTDEEKILYSIYYKYPYIITKENINYLNKILNIKTKSLHI